MSTREAEYSPAEFCGSILGDGIRALFTLPDARHYQFTTDAELIAKAAELDAAPGTKAVYFACGTYDKPEVISANGKPAFRIKSNVRELKAFWLDIDCGADKAAKGAGNTNKKEALQALKDFCKACGLPSPTWIVDSGNGLHLYWALLVPVARATWEATTVTLDALCKACGFIADPSRTRDAASVLRLPGTMNRKDPANPKPVAIKHQGKPTTHEEFDRIVSAALAKTSTGRGEAELLDGAMPAFAKSAEGNLTAASVPARKHTLEEVESALAFIDPDCDRATWWKVLGALAHEFGEDARALGCRWSAGHLPKGGAA